MAPVSLLPPDLCECKESGHCWACVGTMPVPSLYWTGEGCATSWEGTPESCPPQRGTCAEQGRAWAPSPDWPTLHAAHSGVRPGCVPEDGGTPYFRVKGRASIHVYIITMGARILHSYVIYVQLHCALLHIL